MSQGTLKPCVSCGYHKEVCILSSHVGTGPPPSKSSQWISCKSSQEFPGFRRILQESCRLTWMSQGTLYEAFRNEVAQIDVTRNQSKAWVTIDRDRFTRAWATPSDTSSGTVWRAAWAGHPTLRVVSDTRKATRWIRCTSVSDTLLEHNAQWIEHSPKQNPFSDTQTTAAEKYSYNGP